MVPIVKNFIDKEKKARQKIKNKQMIFIEDKVNRTVGILMKAKMISSMEFLDFVSTLRLGVALGITQQWNYQILNELMLICQPAHLLKISGENLTETERDMKRASLIRARLYLN
jgi:protein arginine kinase